MKARLLLALALSCCTVLAQGRSALDLLNAPVPAGIRRIAYGSDASQFGELRVPSNSGPHPVAILVHGGCWSAAIQGLDSRILALDLVRPFAAALNEAGVATWNVEYRRLGNPGGGWPGTFQDVARGADFIRTLAGANRLDLKRVIAIGHSSGGHLAVWLAARAKLPKTSELYVRDPLQLAGVLDLDGPVDLRATIALGQPACGTSAGSFITNLVGGTPEGRPDRYREASPIELLPLGVRQEFLAGPSFAAHAGPYEAAAKRAGDSLRATMLADVEHIAFVDPQSSAWPRVLASVRRLLSPIR
jgi:acetyl esterase/lipase